jgi:hypothetical protein
MFCNYEKQTHLEITVNVRTILKWVLMKYWMRM